MPLAVTTLYAGLLGLFYLGLSAWVVMQRGRRKVMSGDKGDPIMANAMRVHANFNEYVPMLLILMGLAEVNGLGATWMHVIGITLLIARGLHGFGMGRLPHWPPGRGGGAALSFALLLALSIIDLVLVLA
ncbi:MAPEG family protein [Rhodalgimonas zhirmunskyi]|uniref:MAPEG family protein n=1 Tax=Rhodalgimonas zhirmunskyi TaxID=2964767 RepID=A0AAJ1U4E1_9RHOB|nr:MAPEG family protein [Rhodoalgimonas zhirmunskyi]MDQ2093460.1 MAPEG family protein [Rhodoalgimonas zhirmunskyi]